MDAASAAGRPPVSGTAQENMEGAAVAGAPSMLVSVSFAKT